MARVLVIDDDAMFSRMIGDLVKRMGHEVSVASTLESGMKQLRGQEVDLVFLDNKLPDGSGLSCLPLIRANQAAPEVIIITAYGDKDGAELAIKSGAWDYLEKTSKISMITLPLTRALQYREARKGLEVPRVIRRAGIVGSSSQIEACLDVVARAAGSEAGVLVSGETGTGKELFSRAIHENSKRRKMRFVVVDCAAMPPTLVESILFGHEKGAFTSADKAREGLLLQADGGTLFLDEVGELSLEMQKTLLRVLQERVFRPIGSSQEVRSDFRLVAATNRDLGRMIEKGEFRSDLFFRIQAFRLDLPPLRDHLSDLSELLLHHMGRLCQRLHVLMKGFSPELLEILSGYDWPGNVRELLSAIEIAFAEAGDEPVLFPKHLPSHVRAKVKRDMVRNVEILVETTEARNQASVLPDLKKIREDALRKAEREYLVDLLELTGKNIGEACKVSGLSRAQLYRLMKRHQVRRVTPP